MALIQSIADDNAGVSGNKTTTLPVGTTAGNTMLVFVGVRGTIASVTDSASQSYTLDRTFADGLGNNLYVYRFSNTVAAVSSVTIHTLSNPGCWFIVEESGLTNSSPLDVTAAQTQTGVTTWTTGNPAATSSAHDVGYGFTFNTSSASRTFASTGSWGAVSGTNITSGHHGNTADGDDSFLERQVFTATGIYPATGTCISSTVLSVVAIYKQTSGVGKLVGNDGTGWTPVDTQENLFTAGAYNFAAGYTGTTGTANQANIKFGAAGGGTGNVKLVLYDAGGTQKGVSSPLPFAANTLVSAAFPSTAITPQIYKLVVVADAGSPHVNSNSGASGFVDNQYTAAHFPYATPPGPLPADDNTSGPLGHEVLAFLSGSIGTNAYTLSCATTTYAHSISSVFLGSGNNYSIPAAAVVFDRVLGISTDDQLFLANTVSWHYTVNDANFLPRGGSLAVAGVTYNYSLSDAQFSHTQAVTFAAVPCSFDFPNYAAFRTSVQQLIDGDDISQSSISTQILDLIISLGERKVYRDVRSSAQDTALTLTVAGNSAPCPIDLIELRSVYLPTGVPLIYMPYEQLQEKLQIHGTSARKPYYYTFEGDNLIFYPMQGDGTVISGRYYKRFCSIVTEGLSGNTFFNRFPDLWLYASLLECAPYIGEATRMPIWEQKYQEMVMAATNYERRRFTRGSKLSIRVS